MEYVIVVEVDNKRAAAAYRKGMDDLEIAWPQLQKKEDERVERENARYQSGLEKYDAAKAEYERLNKEHEMKVETYEREYKAWLNAGFFKGKRPKCPYSRAPMPFYLHQLPEKKAEKQIRIYTRIKAALQKKLNLAEAALSPFKMTEHDVEQMIAWENGSCVAKLLED